MAIKRGKPVSDPQRASTPIRKVGRYGWRPDLPDHRDHVYAAPAAISLQPLPPSKDLRPKCPPEIYAQGRIGSCTANAIAAAIEFDRMKQGLDVFTPSRLFIYYNERAMEGSVANDAGAQIRDGIKSVATQGDCPETSWTYDDTPAIYEGGPFPPGAKPAQKPPEACYTEAIKYKTVAYSRVPQQATSMKRCLFEGYPFVLGFTVYDSFESDEVTKTGNVPMPASSEHVIGGHAVLCVGYDDSESKFICRNSWGAAWGDYGYFYMPYAYLLDSNLSDDFWTIRVVQ